MSSLASSPTRFVFGSAGQGSNASGSKYGKGASAELFGTKRGKEPTRESGLFSGSGGGSGSAASAGSGGLFGGKGPSGSGLSGGSDRRRGSAVQKGKGGWSPVAAGISSYPQSLSGSGPLFGGSARSSGLGGGARSSGMGGQSGLRHVGFGSDGGSGGASSGGSRSRRSTPGVAANIKQMQSNFTDEAGRVQSNVVAAGQQLQKLSGDTSEGPYVIVRQASPADERNIDEFLQLKHHTDFDDGEMADFLRKYQDVPQSNIVLERHQVAMLAAQEATLEAMRFTEGCEQCGRSRRRQQPLCTCNCHRQPVRGAQTHSLDASQLSRLHHKLHRSAAPDGWLHDTSHFQQSDSSEDASVLEADLERRNTSEKWARLKEIFESYDQLCNHNQGDAPKIDCDLYSQVVSKYDAEFVDPCEFRPASCSDDSWVQPHHLS